MFAVEIPAHIAHGQVFSHFNGFWRHILPGLPEKIKQSQTYGKNPTITSTRLYVLLPITQDNMIPSLKERTSARGSTIKKAEEDLTWNRSHAGKDRPYTLSFYEVTWEKKKFYCVIDIPPVLETIYKLRENNFGDVNVTSEMFQFYFTASMLLNHSNFLPGTVNIQLYNDRIKQIEDTLFDAVCNDLSPGDFSMLQTDPTPRLVIAVDQDRSICLLPDGHPNVLPPDLKFAVVIDIREPDYLAKLVKAINGEPVRLEHSLPTLDVATGLAWGYCVNYLNLTLGRDITSPQDFTNRVKTFVEKTQDIGEGCINKFYSLCPLSCRTGSIVQEDSKGSIKSMGSLEKYQTNVGAANCRTYTLNVYQYTSKETDKKRCFVCEYNTPFNCLGEISFNNPFAGVSESHMHQQCKLIVEHIPKILSSTDVKEKFGDYSQLVELICYDDREKTLLDVMKEKLWEEGLPTIQSDELL